MGTEINGDIGSFNTFLRRGKRRTWVGETNDALVNLWEGKVMENIRILKYYNNSCLKLYYNYMVHILNEYEFPISNCKSVQTINKQDQYKLYYN